MMDKYKKILRILEKILLSILVILMVFPMKKVKLILFFIVILWLIFTIINNKKDFINFFIKPNVLTYSVYTWIIFNLIIMIFTKIIPISFNLIALGLSLLLYLYYSYLKDKNSLKIITITSLIIFLIVSVITLYNLNINESISRILSTGDRNNYNYFGIGSYSFAYGLVFVIISLISLIKNKKTLIRKNIFLILYLILLIYCLIKMGFLISLILLVFGIILLLLNISNFKKLTIFSSISIIICVFLIMSGIALKLTTFIYSSTNNMYFKSRLNDIALVLKGENIEKTDDLKIRLDVYNKSINTFVKSPLIGMIKRTDNQTTLVAGGHSVILDELARYGIIFSLPFFCMITLIFSKIYKSFEKTISKKYWFIIFICALLLAVINTMMFPTLIFMLFTITPTIIKYNELLE